MKNNANADSSSLKRHASFKRSSALPALRTIGALFGSLLLVCLVALVQPALGQRKMENLGRGVVAIRSSASQAFVSWRLLGTEPTNISFQCV